MNKGRWTEQEIEILMQCVNSVLDCELQDLLPNKPWKSIQYKIRQLNFNRNIIPDRFLTKIRVNIVNNCWEWTGFLNHDGYAQSKMGSRSDNSRRTVRLARIFYEEYIGSIPKDLEIDHECKNRACINPYHLEVVTHIENTKRADYSNNGIHEKQKTYCIRNHEFNKNNTYINSKGHRICRVCMRLHAKKTRLKRKISYEHFSKL